MTETETTEVAATRPRQNFYVATVAKEFGTRKEAEDYINDNELDAEQTVLKGRPMSTDTKTRIILN